MEEQGQPKELTIELDEKNIDGSYANFAVVNHSSTEFVIDFISVMPGSPKGRVKSRVIMSPSNIHALIKNLQENLREYQKENSEPEQASVINMPVVGNWEA